MPLLRAEHLVEILRIEHDEITHLWFDANMVIALQNLVGEIIFTRDFHFVILRGMNGVVDEQVTAICLRAVINIPG